MPISIETFNELKNRWKKRCRSRDNGADQWWNTEDRSPIGIFKGQPDQTQGAAANKYCSLPKSHEHTADSYPGDDGRDANRPEATLALLFQLFFVFCRCMTHPSKCNEKLISARNVPVNRACISVFIIFQCHYTETQVLFSLWESGCYIYTF